MNEKAPAPGLLVFLGVCTLDAIARVAAFPEPESRSVAEDFATAPEQRGILITRLSWSRFTVEASADVPLRHYPGEGPLASSCRSTSRRCKRLCGGLTSGVQGISGGRTP